MKETQRGQVTIPMEMRMGFGLYPQTEVEFAAGESGVIIRSARSKKERFQAWVQSARSSASEDVSTDGIMILTRGEERLNLVGFPISVRLIVWAVGRDLKISLLLGEGMCFR